MRQAAASIAELAEKIAGAVPRFDHVGRQVAIMLYRLLSDGSPVPVGRLAGALNLRVETVTEALARYPIFYDDHGSVIGSEA